MYLTKPYLMVAFARFIYPKGMKDCVDLTRYVVRHWEMRKHQKYACFSGILVDFGLGEFRVNCNKVCLVSYELARFFHLVSNWIKILEFLKFSASVVCNPAHHWAGPKLGKEEGWRQEGHPTVKEVLQNPQESSHVMNVSGKTYSLKVLKRLKT